MNDQIIAQIIVDPLSCNMIALKSFIFGAAFVAFFLWSAPKVYRWLGPRRWAASRLEGPSYSPRWIAACALLAVGCGIYAASRQTETALTLFASQVEVKGCKGGWAFDVVYDRSKFAARYAFQRDRGGIRDVLELSEPGKRVTTFNLGTEAVDQVIVLFAPTVLRSYGAQLKSEDQRVPEHLEQLVAF
jgi:hypothetical protein